MEYIEQLNTQEWKQKRIKILSRDGNKCQKCNNENLLSNCDIGYIDSKSSKIHFHEKINKYIIDVELMNSNIEQVYLNEEQKDQLFLYLRKNASKKTSQLP